MAPKVCYVNPVILLRRPIGELLRLQSASTVGLLTPRVRSKGRDTTLHYSDSLHNIKVHTYPIMQPPVGSEWPIPGIKFFQEAHEVLSSYDIVQIWGHFYLSTFILLFMSLFYRKTKVILTIDTLPGYSFHTNPLLDIFFKIYTWTFGRIVYGAPDIITLYGVALKPFAKQSGINMKKVRVIPTGIVKPRQTLKQAVPSSFKGKKIVFFSGIINWRKGVHTIISLAEKFRDEKILFVIAGDGPSRKKLEARVKKEKLTNVLFLGWRKDIYNLLDQSDVFLFPSSAEGLPGSIMEAMIAKTPILTTSIPCTTDLITDGSEGLLCKVGDVECFEKKLRFLLSNKTRGALLAKNAHHKIQTKFSWEAILPQYQKLYRELSA